MSSVDYKNFLPRKGRRESFNWPGNTPFIANGSQMKGVGYRKGYFYPPYFIFNILHSLEKE